MSKGRKQSTTIRVDEEVYAEIEKRRLPKESRSSCLRRILSEKQESYDETMGVHQEVEKCSIREESL